MLFLWPFCYANHRHGAELVLRLLATKGETVCQDSPGASLIQLMVDIESRV